MQNPFKDYQLVDLCHSMHSKMPTWSGNCGFEIEAKVKHSDHGILAQKLKCHAGIGTHMDAPCHFFEKGKSIEGIEINRLIVPLCVLDISSQMAPDLFISQKEIEYFEKKHGKIPKGALFTAYTGWEKFWDHPKKYLNQDASGKKHFPGFSKEAAEYLLKRDISGVGIDTLSPDGSNNGPTAQDYPVHLAVLGAGKYILENLKNLSLMPPQAYAICLPLKMVGASESPCRIIGLISSE